MATILIEVHDKGTPALVNVENVTMMRDYHISFVDGTTIHVDETLEDLVELIVRAR